MEKKTMEEILASECKGQLDAQKVKEILGETPQGIKEYNSHIIEVLLDSSQKPKIHKTLNSIDENFKKEIAKNRDKRVTEDLTDEMRRNLNYFYSIKNCPSYLYHNKRLVLQDFEFFLDIYSDLYSLDKNGLKDVARILKDMMDKYIDGVLKQMEPGMDFEELRSVLDK